jgi:NADH:ubiquinone oxidoreductase subunit 2 (subunit N)
VSLALFLAVTFGATGLALLVSRRPVPTAIVGLGGLAVAVLAAVALDPTEQVTVGGAVVATSEYLRLFLILGASVGLLLAIVGFATGSRRDAPAVTLGTLGAAALAMSLADPRIAVLAITAGGLLAVLLTIVPGGDRASATIGVLELRALIVAGAMAIAAAAWIGRDLSQLVAQPVVFGLAYLAFAMAVAIRFGAIPFHIWAARLTDTVPEAALPIVTAWGPAAFAVVALAWTDQSVAPLLVEMDAERGIVLAVAVATIVLAAFAAWIQDDLEHVVGYSIIGDAGVVLLAIAALDPDAWAPARIWILAYVVTRSAFAAWAASLRATYGTGRIPNLRGWAVRSPVLAIALGLIVLAGIGLPGLAAFDARASLVHLAVPDPFAALVLLATFAPLAYEARLFAVGLRRPPAEVPAPVGRGGLPRRTPLDVNDVRGSAGTFWSVNRAAVASLLTVALAAGALVVAAGGLGGPAAAAGVAPGAEGPSESFVPAPEPGTSFEIPSPVPGEASPGDSFQPIPTN